MNHNKETLSARYKTLEPERQAYLDRAREAAQVTIPSLMPPSGATSTTNLRAGNQSLGARLVNHLTSKLVLTLMPPNRPFHRTDIDEISIAKLSQNPGEKAAIQDALAKYDRALNTHIEASQLRNKANESVKQLIVAGTVVLHVIDERLVRVYKLDSFVQSLDSTGALLELIIREKVSPETLTTAIRIACEVPETTDELRSSKVEEVELFTGVRLMDGKYQVWQEINDKTVPGSEGSYPKESLPFLSMRFYAVDGESYGRSYIEEYMGDLISLEGHAKAINEGAILSNQYKFFVNPASGINLKQLQAARNGAVLRGNAADVTVLRVDKANDMRVGMEVMSNIENRLAYAFLLSSAIQRSGERVTAEEIRVMARELEEGLGGVYSLLSQEFQLPIVRVYRAILEKKKKLQALPKNIISVKIVTGLEALGRGQDVDQLQMFLQDVSAFGPQAFGLLDIREILIRLAVSRGIDTTDLVKTTEQIAQEQQQAQMAQMAQQAAPGVIQEGASRMMDAMAQQQAQGGMTPESIQ